MVVRERHRGAPRSSCLSRARCVSQPSDWCTLCRSESARSNNRSHIPRSVNDPLGKGTLSSRTDDRSIPAREPARRAAFEPARRTCRRLACSLRFREPPATTTTQSSRCSASRLAFIDEVAQRVELVVSYLKPVDREEGSRACRVGARHGLVERLSSRRRQRSIAACASWILRGCPAGREAGARPAPGRWHYRSGWPDLLRAAAWADSLHALATCSPGAATPGSAARRRSDQWLRADYERSHCEG
jgi:hypothetical protein